MAPDRRYRCRFCGALLPAWLPLTPRPDKALLLSHLGAMHPAAVRPYLARLRTEDIAMVAAEAYDVVEDPASGGCPGVGAS